MRLPPLNALRAFESAGRHQSFLLASKELHVSSASVSRFVKMLETDLGQVLFNRHANGVSLTEAGEQYLLAIQPALQTIATVSENTREQNSKSQLTLIAIPAIAEIWLVSRLWNFQQQHRDIQINLVIDDQLVLNDDLVQLTAGEQTIVLNYSHGNQIDTDSFAMPKDRLTLVCNQEVAQSLHCPEDIFNFPLLVDRDWQEDWVAWLQSAKLQSANLWTTSDNKLPSSPLIFERCLVFERYSMVLHATLAGSGVAIGHTTLLQSYLQTGALVAPFDITATSEKQFYALTAKNTQMPAVRSFIDWFVRGEFG